MCFGNGSCILFFFLFPPHPPRPINLRKLKLILKLIIGYVLSYIPHKSAFVSSVVRSSTLGLVFGNIRTGLEPLLCCRPIGTIDGMIALIVCLASISGIILSNSDGGGIRIANDDARSTYRLIFVPVVQSLIQ